MAVTLPKQTSPFERAVLKAQLLEPYAYRINTYSWHVDSSEPNSDGYIVRLAPGGKIDGATCTCKGAEHPYCYHRAAAYLRFQAWLQTEQGKEWQAEFDAEMCIECRLYTKAQGSDYCQPCLQLEEESRLEMTARMIGKSLQQILAEEAELYG